jgi:hypothetical protein
MISRCALVRFFLLGVLVLLLDGCASNPPALLTPVTDEAPVSQSTPNIVAAEGKHTCESIAKYLSENDRQSLYDKFDTRLIIDRIVETFGSDHYTAQQFQNFERRLKEMIPGMLLVNNNQVRWDMLRGHEDGDRYVCLVRTGLNEEGVKYVEFDLHQADGRLYIVDWYDMIRESRMSDSYIELLRDINEMANADINVMPHKRKMLLQEQKQFFSFLAAMRSAAFKKVLTTYDGLPPRYKSKPLYTLIALNMAAMLGDAQYLQMLRTLKQLYGDSDRYGMLLIDVYLEDQEYDKASQELRKFKQHVGQDPLLELLQAGLELERGNKELFYRYCLQVVEKNPNYIDTYWFLFDQLILDQHYEQAVLVLNVLSTNFEISFEKSGFESMEKYRDFSKSAAFKAWKVESS